MTGQLYFFSINCFPDCAPSKLHPVKRRKTSHITLFDPGLVLLNCAALGDVEGVKKLLDQGVNPNVNNVDRITPIHQVELTMSHIKRVYKISTEFLDC